jgi:5-methylcytosine-specific restriction protein A
LSTNERIRGRALQERRERWIRRDPLCKHCREAGRVSLGVELDHIRSIEDGGADDDSNLQLLCEACHAIKTAKDRGYRTPVVVGLDGFPVEGAS